jgi:hypothetical protein
VSVRGWDAHWMRREDGEKVIRYECPESYCLEYFDVTPGTQRKLRDELAAKHSATHLIKETEQFLSKGKK